MKYFEVTIVATETYTIQAEDEEDAFDVACENFGEDFVEMRAYELETQEEIERSKRHADGVFEVE